MPPTAAINVVVSQLTRIKPQDGMVQRTRTGAREDPGLCFSTRSAVAAPYYTYPAASQALDMLKQPTLLHGQAAGAQCGKAYKAG